VGKQAYSLFAIRRSHTSHMSKEQAGQQGKSQKSQKPKQQPKPKPLAPIQAPPELVWEAPVPAPEILRQALGDPSQMTPDTLRQLQRTMGNEFTQQYVHNSVPEALSRVQALSSPTQQSQREPEENGNGDLMDPLAAHPMASSLGMVPPVANSVQRATDPLAGQDVGGPVESDIESKKGGGQALPDNTRDHMEGVLGSDLGGVRVHTDSESNQLNESLNAKAFTTGSDIFFSEGEYSPDSQSGQKLLAHELTHVVQQGASQPKAKTQRAVDEEETAVSPEESADTEASASEEISATAEAAMETVSEASADLSRKEKGKADTADKSGKAVELKQNNSRILQPKPRTTQQDERREQEMDGLDLAPPTPTQSSAGMAAPEKMGPQKAAMRQEQSTTKPPRKASAPAMSATEFRHNLQRLVNRTQAHRSSTGNGIRTTQPDDRYEREAEQAETAVLTTAPPAPTTTTAPTADNVHTPPIARQAVTPMPQQILARKPLSIDQASFQKQISRSLQDNFKNPKQVKRNSVSSTINRVADDAVQMAHDQLNDPAGRDQEIQREIDRKKGEGKPLSGMARRQMEGSFDADFSNVRVHNDPDSHKLARSVDAQAFTTGSDIFFGEGSYTPASTSGQKLLAHELTHVMQQGAAPAVQKKESSTPSPQQNAPEVQAATSPQSGIVQTSMRVSHPDDKYEKEADAVAQVAINTPQTQRKKRDGEMGAAPSLQRADDDATMIKPGGETKENPPEGGGGDNSPAKDKVSQQTDNKKAAGAADGASKDASNTTKKSGGKAESQGKQNESAARGNKGKHGGGGNAIKAEESALPGDAVANLQKQPPSVQDPSTTMGKLGQVSSAAERMPDVAPETVMPNWSDMASGTVQFKKKKGKSKKEAKKEIVDKQKSKSQGKKDKTKNAKAVKPKKKKEKGKQAAEKGKATKSEPEGGSGKKVPQVQAPPPKPLPPELPEIPKHSEKGGVMPMGTPPMIDTQAMSQEVAWMQSPRMQKITKVMNEGVLDEHMQKSQENAAKKAEGGGKTQRKAIQRKPSGLATPSMPQGFNRRESGLYAPDEGTAAIPNRNIVTPSMPTSASGLTTGLSGGLVSRTLQRSPVSIGDIGNNFADQAVSHSTSDSSIQRAGDGGNDMANFGFLGPELAAMFAGGGGAAALMNGGLDMDMGAAMSGAGGGGFAEGMMSSGGAMDVLNTVGMNTSMNAGNLPLPDPNFVAMAAEQYSPVAWFDQTVGGLGDSAGAVADGFASVGAEATVWGKIAATMEALGTVIDLISQILDIVSLVMMIIDILCTVMLALAPLTIVVVLVPIFPFIWTPGVFSPIKAGVASVGRILDKVADVLGIIGDVLLTGATIFRFMDMLETLADPKPSEERQEKLDAHVNQFAEETTAVFSNTMADQASQAASGRENIMSQQKQRMEQRKQGSNNKGNPPPEPPMGMPELPPEAAPGSFDDYGDASGDLAAQENALLMQQEEIGNMMEMGQSSMEELQSSRDTGDANRKGVDEHKKDMNKKKGKQGQMKKKAGGGKGKMGKGKKGGGKGKALMGIVMPMIMPLMSFAMMWGAGGDAETDEAKSGSEEGATKMSNFFSANEMVDKLSASRMMQTVALIGKATANDDKLAGLDGFLGEKFDMGMQTMGMLQQDSGLIDEQLAMVREDRQAMMGQQANAAGAATTWMESSRQSRESMFMQLEQGLGTMSNNE